MSGPGDMPKHIDEAALLDLIGGDSALVEDLKAAGIIAGAEYDSDEVERVLVSRTLVRELEINLAGVEVILRLREELLEARADLAELAALMRQRR